MGDENGYWLGNHCYRPGYKARLYRSTQCRCSATGTVRLTGRPSILSSYTNHSVDSRFRSSMTAAVQSKLAMRIPDGAWYRWITGEL